MSVHIHNVQTKGYTALVNGEVSVQSEMAAAPGQLIALQAFNSLKQVVTFGC